MKNSLPQALLHENFMREALLEAQIAASVGEVPVGAIVVSETTNKIISRAHNLVETSINGIAHAEILAIQEAQKILQTSRLTDCTLYVTLEPCTMCIGAILLTRIPKIIFGTFDPRLGAVGSQFNLSNITSLGLSTEVISGVLEKECEEILKSFFIECRKE